MHGGSNGDKTEVKRQNAAKKNTYQRRSSFSPQLSSNKLEREGCKPRSSPEDGMKPFRFFSVALLLFAFSTCRNTWAQQAGENPARMVVTVEPHHGQSVPTINREDCDGL
jgi:hypothetical protein